MRVSPRIAALTGAGALLGSVGLATTAAAGTTSIKDGFYSSIVLKGYASADVELHVRGNGSKIPGLSLGCIPKDQSLLGGEAVSNISIFAPALSIKGGVVSYSGAATIKPSGTVKVTGHTTLKIFMRHVSGPVVHYTFENSPHSQTTAWKGSVSSPACSTITAGGKVLLFGPVPGE